VKRSIAVTEESEDGELSNSPFAGLSIRSALFFDDLA